MTAPKSILVLLTAALAAVPCSAQGKSIPPHLAGGAGLRVVDGALWGVGARYKVRFSSEGFELTPALGGAAPRNLPLRWRLASIARDGAAPEAQDAVVPSYDGMRVEYARAGVRERYDVRPDGVEQSFVFDALPPGDGDLIVRGRIATDLAVAPDGDGLRLVSPEESGLRIGGVTGIDADGRAAQGTLHCRDGAIELVLPRAFVDAAALPLTLDPLITVVDVSYTSTSFASNDLDPDVAYDLSNDRYLAVWERAYSSTDSDIMAAAVKWGTPLVPPLYTVPVTTGPARDTGPSVGNVNSRDAFVVAWMRNADIVGRSVCADDGALSAEAVIAGGAASQSGVDIGGNAVPGDDDAVCVWLETQGLQRKVMSKQVQVDANLALSFPTLPETIAAGVIGVEIPTAVKISKSGGPAGPNHSRFAVVYAMQDYVRPLADSDVRAVIVNRNAVPIAGPIDLGATPAFESLPDVDGDGDHWVAAWDWEVVAGAGVHDECARAFSMARGQVFTSSPIVKILYGPTGGGPSQRANVCWTGQSCLISYSLPGAQPVPSTFTVVSVDLLSCAACETEHTIASQPLPFSWVFGAPGGASAMSGGATTDDALIVYAEDFTAGQSAVRGAAWQTEDGVVRHLADACGDGGAALATCARVGNGQFAFRLIGSAPSKPTALFLSGRTLGWSCGACTLIPDPSAGVVIGIATDADGSAALPVPLPDDPALRGVPLYEQWLTVRPATAACALLGVDMSSAIEIEIQ